MPFLDEPGLLRLATNVKNKFATKDTATPTKAGLMSSDDKNRLDEINDETTGINLLRGSRDFIRGTTKPGFGYGYPDGFSVEIAEYQVSKDVDGFAVVEIPSADVTKALYSQQLYPSNISGTFTVSFEAMVEDISLFDKNQYISTIQFMNNTSSIFSKGIALGNAQSGKWQQYKFTFTSPIDGWNWARVGLRNDRINNGSIYFRKLKLEEGSVNNPIWSPSPFDYPTNREVKDMLDDAGSTDMSEYAKKTELAEIKSDVASINDYTTGINLLRGTRDFTLGTQNLKAGYYDDGFSLSSGTNNIQVIKRDKGFAELAVAPTWNGSSNVSAVSSKSVQVLGAETYTFSCECFVESTGTLSNSLDSIAINVYDKNSTGVTSNRVSYETFSIGQVSSIELNKWFTVVYTFSVPETVKEDSEAFIGIIFWPGTSSGAKVRYRKAALYKGFINNPIWASSPFDIDYINDETTGINLIKCTRDAPIGVIATPENQYIKIDGYRPSNDKECVLTKDKDGFGVWELIGSSANNYIYSTPAYALKEGLYTIGFEYMLSEDFEGSVVVQAANLNLPVTGNTFNVPVDVEKNKWHRTKHVFSVTRDGLENQFVYINIRINADTVGSFYIRKICIYQGAINNPIWSPSPFDIDHINDETTGINLLRGTRDFTIGSDRIAEWPNAVKYKDGFVINAAGSTNNLWDLQKDENGFSVFHLNRSGSGFYFPLNPNPVYVADLDSITISLDIKRTITPDTKTVGNYGFRKSDMTTNVSSGDFSVTRIRQLDNIELGKWTRVSCAFKVPDEAVWFAMSIGNYTTADDYFRNLKIEAGETNNPIWSASPFDVAQVADVATPEETLAYLKGSPVTALPNEGIFIGEVPKIPDVEDHDDTVSLLPIPSEDMSAIDTPEIEESESNDTLLPLPNDDTHKMSRPE